MGLKYTTSHTAKLSSVAHLDKHSSFMSTPQLGRDYVSTEITHVESLSAQHVTSACSAQFSTHHLLTFRLGTTTAVVFTRPETHLSNVYSSKTEYSVTTYVVQLGLTVSQSLLLCACKAHLSSCYYMPAGTLETRGDAMFQTLC